MAWSHTGDRVAFWGIPGPHTDLFVYDTALKSLAHGSATSGDAVNVTGIAWAPDDSLLAYAVNSWQGADRGHLWTIDPALSAAPTDLGSGSLPVWLP